MKKEVSLSDIEGIELAIDADVILTQGKQQKIVIEAQQNILDNIKKEVKNDSWRIGYDKNVKNAKDVKIYITMETIEKIVMSGSGTISTKGKFSDLDDVDIAMSGSGDIDFELESDEINLAMSGSGNVHMAGSADSFNIAISGSGDIKTDELAVEDCDIAISGSGHVTVHVTETLDVSISGSGDVQYKGDAKVQSRIIGSGDVVKI